MKWVRYMLMGILAVLFLLVGLLNTETVEFKYIIGSARLPMIVVILLSFVIGALLMIMVFGFKAMVWKRRALRLQAVIDKHNKRSNAAAVQSHFEKESAKSL